MMPTLAARAAVLLVVATTGCREVYQDSFTGYSVRSNQRYYRGIGLTANGILPVDGDRGEAGVVNPGVLEYVFAAPEGPFARYYDLMLSLRDPPDAVRADVYALDAAARQDLAAGVAPGGRDYARALGRKLAGPINRAFAMTGGRFEGTAGVYWGMPVDLDRGIVLAPEERDGQHEMVNTIIRYQRVGLIVIHSSALQNLLIWDVSEVRGAFDEAAALDRGSLEAIAALHPIG